MLPKKRFGKFNQSIVTLSIHAYILDWFIVGRLVAGLYVTKMFNFVIRLLGFCCNLCFLLLLIIFVLGFLFQFQFHLNTKYINIT